MLVEVQRWRPELQSHTSLRLVIFLFPVRTHFPSLLWFYSTHLWSKWAMLMGTQCSHTGAHIGTDLRRWSARWCDQCCHNVAYHGLVMLHGSWRPSEESNDSFLNDYTSGCGLRRNTSSLLWIYQRALCNYLNDSPADRAISLWVYGKISSRNRTAALWCF